jgi:hypothetical protein
MFNNASSYFCVLNYGQFVCEVDMTNNFDTCNLGEFMRVRTTEQGEAFNLNLDYQNSVATVPGK